MRETLRSQAETPMLWAGDPVVVSDRARRRLFRNVAASVAVGILVAVIVISSLPMGERSIPAHPPGPAVPRGDGKIAFAQGRDLYVIDSNGNEKTLVAQGCTGETCAIWSVAWSPQGTELVFAYYSEKNSTLGPRDGPLYLVRPDGSGLTALTDCRWPNCHDYAAAWSPDGRRIALSGAGVKTVPALSTSSLPTDRTWSPSRLAVWRPSLRPGLLTALGSPTSLTTHAAVRGSRLRRRTALDIRSSWMVRRRAIRTTRVGRPVERSSRTRAAAGSGSSAPMGARPSESSSRGGPPSGHRTALVSPWRPLLGSSSWIRMERCGSFSRPVVAGGWSGRPAGTCSRFPLRIRWSSCRPTARIVASSRAPGYP